MFACFVIFAVLTFGVLAERLAEFAYYFGYGCGFAVGDDLGEKRECGRGVGCCDMWGV